MENKDFNDLNREINESSASPKEPENVGAAPTLETNVEKPAAAVTETVDTSAESARLTVTDANTGVSENTASAGNTVTPQNAASASAKDTDASEKTEPNAAAGSTAEVGGTGVSSETPPYYNHLAGSPTATPAPRPTYPEYNTSHVSGSGNISYTPTGDAPAHRAGKGGRMSRAGIAILVIAGLLLSTGFGMIGAFLVGGVTYSDGTAAGGDNTPSVIYKTVEHAVGTADGSDLTYAYVESAVGDSVVAISTEYKNVGLWQQYVTSGAGSGVVISEDGYIITNNHVVCRQDNSSKYADTIKVSMKNGDSYDATVVAGDADADIAVLRIDAEGLTAAVFGDSDGLVVGEEVIAIGNPLGELSGTTTNGIISALARKLKVDGVEMNLLQTNAAINPGNSGGGLFNMKGELIGIVNAKSSGTGIEGLGFAIPANDALNVATQLIENGHVEGSTATAKIGITVLTVNTEAQAKQVGVNALGVYVAQLESGYNEDVLQVGDRISAVNGTEITTGQDVTDIVKASSPGDTLEFSVYRDGKLLTLKVKCYSKSGETDQVDF